MTAATSAYTVLVVDDDPDIVLALQDFLDHDGYRVSVAGTCADALLQARAHQYNAVLLDLGLPDGDGSSVLRTLQEQQPQLPVIILTAFTSTDRTVGSLTQGAFAYLTKPYNRDELRAVLARAVGVQALAAKAEHAEHALSESEARFRSLVEAATDSIVLADHKGSILSWNRAASRLFGYTDEEVRGRPLTMLMPLRHRAAHERGLARVRETGQSRLIGRLVELEGLRKDGSEFPLELSLAMWKADDAVFYSGIIRDITQRRRAEDILDRLRHLHEVILTQAGEGIYGLDQAGLTTFVNPTAARLLGYEPSELTEQPMHALLHHSHQDGSPYPPEDCPIYAALHDGLVHRVSTDVFWRKDGTAVPVEYVSTPIIEKGAVAGAVVVFRDITDRKEAERAVEESQERFRQLAEHIKEVFWITDPTKNQVIYISPGYEEIWGRSCGSLYAAPLSWMDAIHPEDRRQVQDAAMTKQSQGTYDEEYRILRPDGSMRWIWDRAYPIRDATGTVYRIVGFAEDVTERKRIEAALIESERRYRVLFDDNPSMYFMVDAEGRVLSVNRFGAERLGYQVNELLGASVLEVFHPDDRDQVRRNLDACLSEMGQPMRWEFRKVRKDGSVIWVRETAQAVRNDRAVPVVMIVCEDITAIKEVELALRVSEERMELVTRGSNDGFWDGRLLPGQPWYSPRTPVWWSPRVREMLGYSEEEFPNVLESWASRLHPDDRERVFQRLAVCNEPDMPQYDVEYRLLTKQGEYRWFHARAEVVERNAQGLAVRMAGSLRCINDRKRAEEALHRSEELLRSVINNTTAVIYAKQADGRYLIVNQRFEQLFHLTQDQIRGKTDHDIFPQDIADAFRKNDRWVLENGRPLEIEEYAPHADGLHTYLSVKVPILDQAGRVSAMCGISTDITERKQAEEQLRLSEERLRMALTASEVGIWDWDVPSGRLYWSAGVEALFGLAAGSFPGTYAAYIELVYLLDRGTILTNIERSLRDQVSVNVTHRVIWPDGTLHWLAWTGRIQRDAQGAAVRVLGIVHETRGRR
ncbi:MAG: diguanylate cyclase/phosphodiesterase (GGDEF & EAL domains) with PAS/PAC sensor(s) [Nitrospira sp.]|jgi:PAS domain S-box-containing protein|nr:MAG: diguanylate cyclase/phosphodiesterase (GGDEF & EAL domains) with PAS/PAC sensor(s) [Nitrospira sp.]